MGARAAPSSKRGGGPQPEAPPARPARPPPIVSGIAPTAAARSPPTAASRRRRRSRQRPVERQADAHQREQHRELGHLLDQYLAVVDRVEQGRVAQSAAGRSPCPRASSTIGRREAKPAQRRGQQGREQDREARQARYRALVTNMRSGYGALERTSRRTGSHGAAGVDGTHLRDARPSSRSHDSGGAVLRVVQRRWPDLAVLHRRTARHAAPRSSCTPFAVTVTRAGAVGRAGAGMRAPDGGARVRSSCRADLHPEAVSRPVAT